MILLTDRRALVDGPSGLDPLLIPYAHCRRHPVHGTRIVYYLERGDGLIKIGTTGNYVQRHGSLRAKFGPLALLAWEPGSYELEKARHQWFMWERPGKSEWFEPSAVLIRHVETLRLACA